MTFVTESLLPGTRIALTYAFGKIPEADQFFFTGPAGKRKLRAQNLLIFMQLADGVDDATLNYHLRRGDYTAWFRDAIEDTKLADAAQGIQDDDALSAAESRRPIREQIEERYTLPACGTGVGRK